MATRDPQVIQSSETSDTTSNSTSPPHSEIVLPSSPTSSTQSDFKHPISGLPRHFPELPATSPPLVISTQDAQTPDNWIARDDRLVRLTGKHPFNCEAKLGDLFSAASFISIVGTLSTDFSFNNRASSRQPSSSMFVIMAPFRASTRKLLGPGPCECMDLSRTSASLHWRNSSPISRSLLYQSH